MPAKPPPTPSQDRVCPRCRGTGIEPAPDTTGPVQLCTQCNGTRLEPATPDWLQREPPTPPDQPPTNWWSQLTTTQHKVVAASVAAVVASVLVLIAVLTSNSTTDSPDDTTAPQATWAEAPDRAVTEPSTYAPTPVETCTQKLALAASKEADAYAGGYGGTQELIDEYGVNSKMFSNATQLAGHASGTRTLQGVDAAVREVKREARKMCRDDLDAASRKPTY